MKKYHYYTVRVEEDVRQIIHMIIKKDAGAFFDVVYRDKKPEFIESNIRIDWPQPLVLIVAGGRDYDDYDAVEKYLDYLLQRKKQNEVLFLSGACDVKGKLTFTREDGTEVYGADGLGERYAKEKGHQVKHFPANWKEYGKKASFVRNNAMAERATALVAFWDNKSKGTRMMIELAEKYGLTIKKKMY